MSKDDSNIKQTLSKRSFTRYRDALEDPANIVGVLSVITPAIRE